MNWVNAVIHGILLGGVYALLASGLSLMFGVMRIINLAHGVLALLGAYFAYLLTEHLDISTYVALHRRAPGRAGPRVRLQRTMLERSLRAGELVPLLTTFGLLIVIANLLQQFFSPDVHSLDAGAIGPASWHISSELSDPVVRRADPRRRGRPCSAACSSCCRAHSSAVSCAQRRRTPRRPNSSASTRAASTHARPRSPWRPRRWPASSTAMRSAFDPITRRDELLFAFEAVVIGGIGSLWGTLVGGIVLGVAQTVGAQIDVEYFALGGHVVFLAVLVVRAITQVGAVRLALLRVRAA